MRVIIFNLATLLLMAICVNSASAEPQVRATADIMDYEIQGTNLTMAPDDVRDTILAAGFDDVSMAIPGLWEFSKGRAGMSVTYYDGRVESIGYSMFGQNDIFLVELDRIRNTFSINLSEAGSACQYNAERGGACAVGDATDDSRTVTASVQATPMMINMAVSRTDLRR